MEFTTHYLVEWQKFGLFAWHEDYMCVHGPAVLGWPG